MSVKNTLATVTTACLMLRNRQETACFFLSPPFLIERLVVFWLFVLGFLGLRSLGSNPRPLLRGGHDTDCRIRRVCGLA